MSQDSQPAQSEEAPKAKRKVRFTSRVSFYPVGSDGTYRFLWREPRPDRVDGESATLSKQATENFIAESSAKEWAELKARDLSRKYAGVTL